MGNFLTDILKSRGKYSRKSIIIVLTFLFTLGVGLFIVIDNTPNPDAIKVFDSSLIFLTALLGISVFDKKLENKDKPADEL